MARRTTKSPSWEAAGSTAVLSALLADRQGLAAQVLRGRGVDPARVVADLAGEARGRSAGRVVESAAAEAERLGDSYIGTEHLLLGLLGDGDDPAAVALAARGGDYSSTRAAAAAVREECRRAHPPLAWRAGAAVRYLGRWLTGRR
jgi:ATP-dependent Clp protease ATP-binding subunit ClpA